MKIITDNGEYTFHYQDDTIIHADLARVQITLINIEGGNKVTLEIDLIDLALMAQYLCEHVRCGICDKPLWQHDDGKWNYMVGHICTPCARESGHPAAQMHRGFEEMVEQAAKERDEKYRKDRDP
jgi:hypothetical protein